MDSFDFNVGLDDPPPAKPKRKQNSAPSAPILINDSTSINKDGNLQDINIAVSSAKDLKAPLTDQELKFIELYLIEKLNRNDAMIQAGYTGCTDRWRYVIASRILQKYESRAQDRRNLFRELGAGEIAICQGLLELARGPYPAAVRRAAWSDLASCMGLKQEQVENFQGVTLNVYSQAEAKRLGIEVKPPASSGSLEPQHIQITK